MRQITIAIGLLALSRAVALGQSSVDRTIDRAVDARAKVKTARATFEQTLTNPLTGGSATARGEFQEQRPDRLAIRFTDPVGDRIVADGRAVWLYLPSSTPGQVIRRAMNGGAPLPIDITGEFLDSPREKYEIADGGQDVVDGASAHVLVLTPKNRGDVAFTRVRVWVLDRDGMIRQFETVEPAGVIRRVKLTSLAVNVPVERSAFTFIPPRGVRVVDQLR